VRVASLDADTRNLGRNEIMRVDSAIELINNLCYKPDWKITATDHTNRFESAIIVKIDYPARNSDMELAPDYKEEIMTYATFPLVVATCDDVSLYRQVADVLMKIECHEMREFLRVRPTYWAPFNPHRVDGMTRWNPADTALSDLHFGIA